MEWEFDILYGLQKIHNPVLDWWMAHLSDLGNIGLFWLIVAAVMTISKKYRKCGIQTFAAMLLTFIIGNLILKNLVARDRPCWIDPSIALLVKSPLDYSFPSGHTMNGFTAAVTIFCNDRKLGICAIILASLIAFSRLYNFVNFPTDVLVGMVIGIGSALIVNYLKKRYIQKKQNS